MAPSFASTSTHVDSVPAPDQKAQESTAPPAPKKKPRTTALADAKKILRASTAVTSKSLAAPEFVHRPPDIARHRRKCAVCHHPEREIIEDLFIHWHSPSTIAEYYEDDGSGVNWVSIYRHAYAFGLDEVRRRNLRFAFELIIEQAADIHATPAAVIASARALGSCVNPDGRWTEPARRVHVTNHIYHHNVPAQVDFAPLSSASAGPPSLGRVENDPSSNKMDGELSSYRAHHPHEVLASAHADSQFVSSASAAPAVSSTVNDEQLPYRAPHPLVLSEVEGRDVLEPAPAPADSQFVSSTSAASPSLDRVENDFSFRAPYPHDVVESAFAPAASNTVNTNSSDIEVVPEDSSIRAFHPRDVVPSQSAPATSQFVSSASAAPAVSSTVNDEQFSFRAPHPHDVVSSDAGRRSLSSDTKLDDEPSSFRAPYPREVVPSRSAPTSDAPAAQVAPASLDDMENASSYRALYPHDVVTSRSAATPSAPACPDKVDMGMVEESSSFRALHPRDAVPSESALAAEGRAAASIPICSDKVENSSSFRALHPRDVVSSDAGRRSLSSDTNLDDEPSSFRAPYPREVVSGDEIRNSLNSFKSKEPPISNR